jgi:hypothetical protein
MSDAMTSGTAVPLGRMRAQRSPDREADFSNLPAFAKTTFKIEHKVAISSRQNKKR